MDAAPAPADAPNALRVAVLADDLTGASDTVVQFAELGWTAFLQRGAHPPPLPDVAAVAQALNTRALPDAAARERTRAAVQTQLDAGVTRLYLKIDSTMRGSVAAQLAGALAAWRTRHAGAFVVLCPAYPAMGRTIRDGQVRVHGEPLEDSPAGTDPVTPVRTSDMQELVPGAAVVPALPADELRAAILATSRDHAVVAVDAERPSDLETLAAVARGLGPSVLPAGSAGLALPLAAAWHPAQGDAHPAAVPRIEGRILILVSSANDVSKRQVRACLEALGARATAVTLGTADLEDLPPARAWAERLVLAPACGVLIVQAPTERLTGGSSVEAGARVAKGLAVAVERLMSREPVGALVLVGGDGAEATLTALGVEALRVLRLIVEGVPLSATIGVAHEGLVVVTKAGGFGDDATLLTVIRTLQGGSKE